MSNITGRNFRDMSIAEALADKEAMQSFALATGFPLIDDDVEKLGRRARWARRKGAK